MILAFFVGIIAGFIASIPVAGPVAVLVLRNALEGKWRDAFMIAGGSAAAESISAALAFVGVAALTQRFPLVVSVSHVFSAIALLGVGIYLVRKRVTRASEQRAGKSNPHKILLGFSLTAFNPTLIVSWATVITTLHANSLVPSRALDAVPFAIGVLGGILGWFWVFVSLVRHFRDRFRESTMTRLVHVLGWALVIGGIAMGIKTAIVLSHAA